MTCKGCEHLAILYNNKEYCRLHHQLMENAKPNCYERMLRAEIGRGCAKCKGTHIGRDGDWLICNECGNRWRVYDEYR